MRSVKGYHHSRYTQIEPYQHVQTSPELPILIDGSEHNFEYVIVYQLDRFSQAVWRDSALYKAYSCTKRMVLISANENISNEFSWYIILESVLEGMAEYYSARIA